MENLVSKPERSAGIDIYKILCMFFVIWFHFSDHGSVQITANDEFTFNWLVLAVSRIFGGICNCTFVLSTGYFLCTKKFNAERIFKLWLEVCFYSVLCGTIAFAINNNTPPPLSLNYFLIMLMPFSFNQYWFFTDYLVLILLSPVLNLLIEKTDKKQHLCLTVFCFLILSFLSSFKISHGGGINYTFIFLYLLAAYLRKYKPEQKFKNSLYGWIGLLCFLLEIASIFAVRYRNFKLGKTTDFWIFIWGMEKVPCILTSVFLFIWFANLKVKYNKFIGFLSSSLFAVYLLHIGRLWELFFRILFNNEKTYYTNYMLPQLILCSVTIFFGAILLDKLRIKFFEKPIIFVLKKITENTQADKLHLQS
ncbi:MAG: acyltransferase [Treponema sp.]|nr:acyltransferase [Treponema sp.]